MEVVASVAGALVVEPGRLLFGSIHDTIGYFFKFQSNLNDLEKEMKKLMGRRDDVKREIEAAEREGKLTRALVEEWLTRVNEIEVEVNSMRAGMEASNSNVSVPGCCLSCSLRCKLRKKVIDKLVEVKRLADTGSFLDGVAVVNLLPKPVEHIPGPSIEGQSTVAKNLAKIMNLLNDERFRRIGIWGMGGVGKTTLVKNLNNKLLKNTSSSSALIFSTVIWVTVSKELDLRGIQTQIAKRLKLEVKNDISLNEMAIRLHERLEKEKHFLLILDDVWEAIDLDHLGVPRPEFYTGSKIILTSRLLEVCGEMMTDVNIKVDVLNDEEAWRLFCQNAGEVAISEHIKPFAEAVAKECSGLPLAIIAVGASMRGKTMVQLWKDALNALRRSVPLIKGIEHKVYKPLKWSYDSLQGENIKSCFLFCCLYPEDFSIEVSELVRYWFVEGLLDELQNYEELENRGMAIIECLKDSCLLENGNLKGTVKMHDVVRDVAIWIAFSLEDGCKSLVSSRTGLVQISEYEWLKNFRRLSFMNNKIKNLPHCVMQCPQASTLLLQGNNFLEIVPEQFLLGFQALRVLDLSGSRIKSLPLSLLQLGELRALLLHQCFLLEELPALGGLSRLQVLDCHGTRIKELPEGMERLTKLRQLDLSYTGYLKTIHVGKLSGLSNLEFLDMRGSAYKWDTRGKVEEGQAPFEELLCLEQLLVLYIELESIPFIAPKYITWIKRLRKFKIDTGDGTCIGEILDNYYERHVIIKYVSFLEEWIGWLFLNATSVDMLFCEELNHMLEKLVVNSASVGCLVNLKSLHISFSHSSFQPAAGGCGAQFDLLPNLEELRLVYLGPLESISDIIDYLGLKLSRLRLLQVRMCPGLKYLLSIGHSILTLEKLEEVEVISCEKLNDLFKYDSSTPTSAPDPVVPNLQIMRLEELPKLKTLCRQDESWPLLEQLEVINCNLIRKLPLTTQNANTIKEIRGESQWWSHLEWEDDDTKSSLQHYFTPLDTQIPHP